MNSKTALLCLREALKQLLDKEVYEYLDNQSLSIIEKAALLCLREALKQLLDKDVYEYLDNQSLSIIEKDLEKNNKEITND